MSNVETKSGARKHPSEKSRIRKKMSKAEIQLAIIKKKQCDAKALVIVEQLLEPAVNVQWLLQNLRYINKSHLEDVIEERAIVKLCGYVLCNKPLTVVITQQYHISVKKNKVYDVSKRKNFCSSRCYGASSYLLEQMLTSPLWLRDKEEVPVFQLLPSTHELKHSVPGEEVEIDLSNFHSNTQQGTKSGRESCGTEHVTDSEPESGDKQCPVNRNFEETNTTIDDELINRCSSEYVKNILNSSEDTYDRLNHILAESTRIAEVKKTENHILETVSQPEDCTEQEFTVLSDASCTEFNTDTSMNETNVKKEEEVISAYRIENIETDNSSGKCKEKSNSEIFPRNLETVKPDRIPATSAVDESNEKENTAKNEDKLDDRKDFKAPLQTSEISEHEIVSAPTDVPQDKSRKKRSDKKRMDKSTVDNSKKSYKNYSEEGIYTLAMRVEKSVKEWITEDTLCLLLGEADEKHKLIENITKHDKYLHICKRLNRLQMEDIREERTESATKDTLKPIPSLVDLEEEGKKMEIKVRAFYNGRMEIGPVTERESTKKKDEPDPIFPLVDAYAPKALRRRIFLDKLNRTLPDLLRALAGNSPPHVTARYMYSGERCSAIKTLATTFNLTATNIVFKTAEWTLVGLILMKMLSIMDPSLKALLARKQASMYISMILMSYKLDSNYIDRLVAEITYNPGFLDVDGGVAKD